MKSNPAASPQFKTAANSRDGRFLEQLTTQRRCQSISEGSACPGAGRGTHRCGKRRPTRFNEQFCSAGSGERFLREVVHSEGRMPDVRDALQRRYDAQRCDRVDPPRPRPPTRRAASITTKSVTGVDASFAPGGLRFPRSDSRYCAVSCSLPAPVRVGRVRRSVQGRLVMRDHRPAVHVNDYRTAVWVTAGVCGRDATYAAIETKSSAVSLSTTGFISSDQLPLRAPVCMSCICRTR